MSKKCETFKVGDKVARDDFDDSHSVDTGIGTVVDVDSKTGKITVDWSNAPWPYKATYSNKGLGYDDDGYKFHIVHYTDKVQKKWDIYLKEAEEEGAIAECYAMFNYLLKNYAITGDMARQMIEVMSPTYTKLGGK